MIQKLLFVGLDVDDNAFHGHFIAEDGKSEGGFSCKPSLGSLEKKWVQLKREGFHLKICYEATYLGFSLHRDLRGKGDESVVIAPSLVPQTPGDQIKTDRLDSKKLDLWYRAGLLTEVHIPDEQEEAIRDLLRARKYLTEQMKGIKCYILCVCRRMGLNYRESVGRQNAQYWTLAHQRWLEGKIKELKGALGLNLKFLLLELEQLERILENYVTEIDRLSKTEKYHKPVQA